MKFQETKLAGAFIIELDKIKDNRGFFSRSFCMEEFDKHGLNTNVNQCNISFNKHAGTLRGMHYQVAPYDEAKLIRCTKGSVYDVIVDIRRDSTTYLDWISIGLNEINHKMIYVPEGFAHGFQTLEDDVELFYQMNEFYNAQSASGVRWNDPILKIEWPSTEPLVSEKDASYPDIVLRNI